MAVFRRGRGKCPACDRDRRITITDAKSKAVETKCTCGHIFKVPVTSDWWVSYRSPDGKNRTEKIGPDRARAKSIEAKIRVDIKENKYLDKQEGCTVTVAEALDKYAVSIEPDLKPGVFRDRMRCLRLTCKHFGTGIMLDGIDEEAIEGFRTAKRRAGLKASSVSTKLARLRAFLSWCVRLKMLTARPNISTPRAEGRKRVLTEAESDALLESARAVPYLGAVLADYLLVLLHTCMRRTEALEMRWSWLDFGRGVIILPAEWSKNKNERVIPMSPEVREILERRRGEAVPGDDHVFIDDGKRLTDARAEYGFWKARDAARIKDMPGFHVCRHTAITRLLEAGNDPITVAEIAGHTDLATTRGYVHLSDEHLLKAVGKLSKKPPAPTDEENVVEENSMENEMAMEDEMIPDACQASAKVKNVIPFRKKTGS